MKYAVSTLAMACIIFFSTISYASDEVQGYWYSADNASVVQIFKEKSTFQGRIIWLDEPLYAKGEKGAGKPKVDRENPDKKKRKNPIIGLDMLADFTYDSKGKVWNGGTIYDPERGKTYKCEMKTENDVKAQGGKRLNVRGYIGIPALGRTEFWYRVPGKDLLKYKLIEAKEAE
jgi:uncharacterized protein (DUF2147 family)